MEFKEAVKNRRSHYAISKESPISIEKIEEIIEFAIMHTPTSMNSQEGRVLLVAGDNNQKLWDITENKLKEVTDEEGFKQAKQKIDMFRNSFATAVLFIDQASVKALQDKFPPYAENFPNWAQQSIGILTSNIWVGLEEEGLGLTNQHYQNLIEDEVKKEFNIPESWMMISQMPMGTPTQEAGPKEFMEIEKRFIIKK